MFELLDKSLYWLLTDTARETTAFPTLAAGRVSFMTPEKPSPYAEDTVSLFLYETRENRELREVAPSRENRGAISMRRRPPLRVDCTYLVTAWSKETNDLKIETEHRLLGEAFNCLSRFPEIPERFLQAGNLLGQVFAPPTLVAQMDAVKNVGEFWSALGIAPRPFFNLVVTITMDLDQAIREFPVTTVMVDQQQGRNVASVERRAAIGGVVRDLARQPVPNAWVRLEPLGSVSVTDSSGRFVFDNVGAGAGMTLRARAPGKAEASLANFEIPSLTGSYDLQFPN